MRTSGGGSGTLDCMRGYLARASARSAGGMSLLGALLLVGFAAGRPLQAQSAPASSRQNSTAATTTLPAQTEASQYIIGPGDTVQVFVWRNPVLTQTVPVRPD